jgi:2-keto-3-deoxy-L-rhamnonate aldolase RhmA
LDADFLLHDAAEYAAWANRETFLCVQIETPQAVEQAEAIAAVEGVDMLFVGPGDLGLRLQHETGLTLEEAWQRVAAACQAHGKAYGGPTLTAEEMRKRRTQGAQLLVGSSEFRGWSSELQQSVQLFEALDED